MLEVNDRKSKGAFYTPRDIVYYMCQESLANYLVTKTNVDYNEMIKFIKYGDLMSQIDWENHVNNKTDYSVGDTIFSNLLEIDKALIDVKVADPSVGSGAFPLGMLTEIVKIRNNISIYLMIQNDLKKIDLNSLHNTDYVKRNIFDMKLQTIENCRRKPTIDMLDKIADGMNAKLDSKLNMTASELIRYDKSHITNFTRIDRKPKKK